MEKITKKRMLHFRLSAYLILSLILIGIDQLTKYWAQTKLQGKQCIDVIEGVFSFTYARNTGAAFGMLQGKKIFLLVLTVVVLAVAVWYLIRKKVTDSVVLTASAAVFAGAVGNLIDRIRLSYVIDFLEIRFFSFPVFNVADCCVVLGMIVLVICVFRGKLE